MLAPFPPGATACPSPRPVRPVLTKLGDGRCSGEDTMYEHNQQTQALVDLVRRLVREYQVPLEARALRGELLTRTDFEPGTIAAREAGLWSLSCPQELGGAGLSTVETLAITEENSRCLTPIRFGGGALPPTFALQGEQRRRYLEPFLSGEQTLCMAQTEPAGGGDPAGAIQTRARQIEGGWVINGSKIWISGFDDANTG